MVSKKKFYTVWSGKEVGIFDNWATVQPLVIGVAGSKYQGFESRTEAEAALAGPPPTRGKPSGKGKPKAKAKPYTLDPAYDVHIFCDGGCNPNPGPSGSGLAVYESGELAAMYYGLFDPAGTNNTAELRALQQAMLISREWSGSGKPVQILSDSSYSINAITKWAPGWKRLGWRKKDGELANVELIKELYGVYEEIKGNVVFTHVKGHSGVEGNELADRLSTKAMIEKLKDCRLFRGPESAEELLAWDGDQP
jgi:ribonuclease HI